MPQYTLPLDLINEMTRILGELPAAKVWTIFARLNQIVNEQDALKAEEKEGDNNA